MAESIKFIFDKSLNAPSIGNVRDHMYATWIANMENKISNAPSRYH